MVETQIGMVINQMKNYRPRLTHAVIVKAPGLLPMLYKPSELEQELGVPPRTLQDWLAHGVPHQRDATNHLWINGRDLATWIEQQRATRRLPPVADGQAYCLRCRRAVVLSNPTTMRHGRHALRPGRCPQCEGLVNRGQRRAQWTDYSAVPSLRGQRARRP